MKVFEVTNVMTDVEPTPGAGDFVVIPIPEGYTHVRHQMPTGEWNPPIEFLPPPGKPRHYLALSNYAIARFMNDPESVVYAGLSEEDEPRE